MPVHVAFRAFTASFSVLPALNTGAVGAATGNVSPVRAGRFRVSNVSKLGICGLLAIRQGLADLLEHAVDGIPCGGLAHSCPGERAAAGAAMDRLQRRNRDQGPETEFRFSLSELWSVRLFVAVCRKHGLRPFRHTRQRRTTVMVLARERQFDHAVRAEFSKLRIELELYFQDVTDHLITRAMGSDGADSTLGRR